MSFQLIITKLCGIPWDWVRQLESSMDYLKGVHGNLTSIKVITSKFHGIPKNCVTYDLAAVEFHGIPWNILWNSMEPWCHLKWLPTSSMEFHGTWWHLFGDDRVLWNSMEPCVIWNDTNLVPWNSMERLWYLVGWLRNAMEFFRNFHGSPGKSNVIWISNHQVPSNSIWLGDRVPWNFKEYSMEVEGNPISMKMVNF